MGPFTIALLGSSAASIAGGGLGFLGSQRAAGAQQQAAQQSGLFGLIAQQQAIQAQQEAQRKGAAAIARGTEAYQPYQTAGVGATNRLASLYGPGGEYTQMPTLAQLQMDPSYAFREQQGMKALQQQLAAGGLRGSGTALKAGQRFGQELASTEYGNAYNRFMANREAVARGLGALSGGGLTAAGGIGNLAGAEANLYSTTGTNIANTMLANPYGQAAENMGQARASGYMGGATALGQALQAPAQNYMMYSMMDRFAPGAGADRATLSDYFTSGPFPSTYRNR